MNLEGLHDIAGLQFMAVKSTKVPMVKGWQTFEGKHDLSNCEAVGLVCGKLSGNTEALDLDCKYDLTGNMFDRYKKLVHEVDPNILPKLVVQKTSGAGFHLIYKCKTIAGNLKLANRPTTPDEKKDTYEKTYQAEITKSTSDEKARTIADKASQNDKVRVLFETRGEGGYIACAPSPGYEMIYGDFCSISEISAEERDVLHGVARQFNSYVEEFDVPKSRLAGAPKTEGLSTFDDYNERGDVVALLESYGWKIVGQKGQKTIFLRPGQTTSQTSGNYDHSKKWFSVFTTSTEFDPQKAYMPYAVYAVLECNKNFSEASKKLFDLGFGERKETKKEQPSTRQIPSRINPASNDLSFLATANDYDLYLQQVRDGTLKMGRTTGSPLLDNNFLFKDGDFVSINGIDNTGKSVFIWWLRMLDAMYHGTKTIIFSSENTLGGFMRKMIQFYWGKPLQGNFSMNDREYGVAKKFVEDHFKLIKAQEDLYNYKDIINMVKIAKNKHPDIGAGMIDPYNSLKIDLSGFSKLNTHEYHYEAMSEIKSFGQQNNFSWYVNHHAITNAARAKDGEKKYPVAPGKADTEGGQKVANKTDSFLTIHRVTQHPTEWMITEVHVRKIKDTETGGRPTSMDSPIKFEMYKNGCAFIERSDTGETCIDPIARWHRKDQPEEEKLFNMAPITTMQIVRPTGWKPVDVDFTGDQPF